MANNYRFKEIKLRAYNKDTKKMHYYNEQGVAFAINSTGFQILSLDMNGAIYPDDLGNDSNSVLMQGAGVKDDKSNDIFEGDILFFRRQLKKKLVPVVGIVNARDHTFSVSMGKIPFMFAYGDKNVEVLGNIFEHSDEELASRTELKLKKYESS
jgi:YopX protein